MNIRQRLFHLCAMGWPGTVTGKILPWSLWQRQKELQSVPQRILVTVDVEPGYIDKSGERHWFRQHPQAWVGVNAGMQLLLDMLEHYNIPATFFCCPHNNLASGGIQWWHRIRSEKHEVGLHIHPADDRILAEKTRFKLFANGASFYTHEQRKHLIMLAKHLLEDESHMPIHALRWGNWSMIPEAAEDVLYAGISIDASSCPGLSGHAGDDRSYNWRDASTVPHFLNNTELFEMPISTLSLFGYPLMRLDPAWGQIFLNQYLSVAQYPLLHLITHSSEMCDQQGRPSQVFTCLEQWIKLALNMQIPFDTCTHTAEIWKRIYA